MLAVERLKIPSVVRAQIGKVLAYQRKAKIDIIPDRNWILATILPTQSARILDIGPSPFVFDVLLNQDQRKQYEYHTMDYPDRNETPAKGTHRHIHDANLPGYPFSDEYFDLVLASDVIEHIKENEIFLREISRVLKPDGEFYVTTPNYGSIAALKRVFFGRMMHNPLGSDLEKYCFYDHVRYFTTTDLLRYLRANRFFPTTLVTTGLVTDRGYPFRPFPWNILMKYVYNALPRLHYRFAHQTVIVASKTDGTMSIINV